MCTLLALYRCHPQFPLVVAANRDERLDRPAAGPGVIREAPRAIGGKDLVAGGTWLGLNAHGLFVAVTNRRGATADPARRSRGLLVLDALGLPNATEAARQAARTAAQYNPFNLLLLGPEAGFVVVSEGSRTAVQPVDPGPVAITNGEPNDRSIPNVARGLQELEALVNAPEPELITRLEAVCADHRQEDPAYPPFCLHHAPFGTVSSTLLLLRADGTGRYRFAPGPPCVTPYQEVSGLLPLTATP